jgi:hypothetical protein
MGEIDPKAATTAWEPAGARGADRAAMYPAAEYETNWVK